jgi:acyl-CoA synthetase (AMP-forming)/AMP-acid ligase II
MGLCAEDRSVVAVPMSQVTALTAGIVAMLRAAGCLVIAPPFKAEAFIRLASAERMTQTVMVPAQYNLILMSPALGAADLSTWRVGGYGGAPMPEAAIRELGRRLPSLRLMNAYGSTETTGPVVLMPPAESLESRVQVGRAVPVADIRVVDDAGRDVAPGVSGEILLRAPNTVAGYWRNSEATAESFIDGYWRSGDIGMLDPDGYLTLLDRKKDMINRGGFKIYSVEVENVLASHPAVAEAAVIAKPCPVLGERVHAVVVPRPGTTTPEPADLRSRCAAALADYKVPESFTFRADPLPRNAGGKVLKRALRDALDL